MTVAGRPLIAVLTLAALGGAPVVCAGQDAVDLGGLLARVGAQLERRYEDVQRIVSTEVVWVRSFTHDMRTNGPPRRLEFDRREEWAAAPHDGIPTVSVIRELLSVNGRVADDDDRDACLTPRSESEDPLSVLLPVRQPEFEFSFGEMDWIDGRQVARLDYVPRQEGNADVSWDDDCVSISLERRAEGRAWIDLESADVLRLDERLMRRFEFQPPEDDRRRRRDRRLVLERDDVSIRYERVSFTDPDESLMLPRSIEHNWVLRGSGFVPRYFRQQEFTNHRRFVTGGRIVGLDESSRRADR